MNDIFLNCEASKKCNACQLNNLSYKEQLNFKQKKVEKNIGGFCSILPIIPMETPFSYRNNSQMLYKVDKNKDYQCGIYKSKTKSITSVSGCKLQTARQNEIFNVLSSLLKSFKIKPFDFHKNTGWLKSVIIREGFNSKEIMVVLVGATRDYSIKNTFVTALLKKCPYITTIVTTYNEKDILLPGEVSNVLYGNGYITDSILDNDFIISPNSFFQINPIQTEKLYSKAIELAKLKSNDRVLDAYCGVGTISIIASKYAKEVYGVEINENAIIDANKNKELNNITNVSFVASDVKEYIKELKDIDVAFLDPPRSGCQKEFLESLVNISPKKIVYISCNVETQKEDIAYLSSYYKINKSQPVDMFPHTNHVENIILLTLK